MSEPQLSLLVLRVEDMERAASFYRELGMRLEKHAHGNGPEHYAAELGEQVFELYPASSKFPATSSTRIGFTVGNVDEIVAILSAIPGVGLISAPNDSEWGRRAVVTDLDGHRLELRSVAKS